MTSNYISVNLLARGKVYDAKIEQGCSFENNGSIYRADESGKLKIYEKIKGEWRTADEIRMTNYQLRTFKAVANGVSEEGDNIVLSKADLKKAIKNYKKGSFIKAVSEFLQLGYKADKAKLYSKYNTISTHVTNGHGSESNMLFGFGSKTSAVEMSQIANKTVIKPEQLGKIRKTTDGGVYWVSHKDILYRMPRQFTVSENSQNGISIANKCAVSYSRLKQTNPTIDFSKNLPVGSKVKIPGKYFVKSGAVNSFEDVVKVTGLDKHYIKDILIGIEGRHSKPDLRAYYDGVADEKHPKGYLTIGFGHTSKINGKALSENTKITKSQAYELLAQDILDAKIDAIVYMGKENFENAPKSLQTGIIDIVFNKGVEPFDRNFSLTSLLKSDLERKDYVSAAVDTILGTGCKGLKKRNIYRAIMSMSDLSAENKKSALAKMKPIYEETIKSYDGADKRFLQRAWKNALKGKTHGFFTLRMAKAFI